MNIQSLVVNAEELSDVVNTLDKIIEKIEECSKNFFKEAINISTSDEFQGSTADNLKMFSDKFTNATTNKVSEVTSEVKKRVCMKDGYIDKIVSQDKFRKYY